MGADVETGGRIEEEEEEEGDEEAEDDVSTHPAATEDGGQCLCEQFERNSFCRRLEEEAHVECQWWDQLLGFDFACALLNLAFLFV
jgi:hypothetical protein